MRYLLLVCCATLVFGGTETKPKAEDYEVHAQVKNLAIGAEYMVHSYSRGEQMYIAKDYLVVEVALFPPKGTTFEVQRSDFALRINGRKELLVPSDPTLVLEDMGHPEFRPPAEGPHVEGGGGVNDHDVIFGGPPVNTNPFPGSPIPGSTRHPYPPVDIPRDNPSGVTKEPEDPYKLLSETALEPGEHHAPVSGFLYFHYRGNVKSIKSLELICGDTALKLQ